MFVSGKFRYYLKFIVRAPPPSHFQIQSHLVYGHRVIRTPHHNGHVFFVRCKEILLLRIIRTVFFLLCESLTFSLYSTRLTRTSLMRTTDTFLAQSSDSYRTSTSLVLTLYSSAVNKPFLFEGEKKLWLKA